MRPRALPSKRMISVTRNFVAPFVLFCVVALTGCVLPPISYDVTHTRKFQVGYKPGSVYRLKKDVLIMQPYEGYRYTYLTTPELYAQYVRNRQKALPEDKFRWASIPLGVYRAGSLVRVERLHYDMIMVVPIGGEAHVEVRGTLLGSHLGRDYAVLDDLSGNVFVSYASVPVPDSSILVSVTSASR